MKNFKKVIAGISAMTLIAMNAGFVANAAAVTIGGITTDGQNFTIDLPIGVDHVAGDTITLVVTTTNDGNAVDLSGNNVVSAKLGTDTTGDDSVTANDYTNGSFTITTATDDEAAGADITFALTSALTANTNYTISYDDGTDTGAVSLKYLATDTVTVKASVAPILTMVIANAAADIGELSTAGKVATTKDPTVTVGTNAINGFDLKVESTNNGLTSAIASHTIGAAATGAGTEGYALTVSETTDPQTNGSIVATPVITGGAVTMASSTGPTAGYVATVDIAASISTITPAASDYTDTLTFTVTGNF